MLRPSITVLTNPLLPLWKGITWIWALQNRERQRVSAEMAQMRGLIELIMKQRNGYRWTDMDRKKIRAQLRNLADITPYLILFVSPGGFFALPILAWWLDRRRLRRKVAAQATPPTLAGADVANP